jgi:hypothetical protein
MEKGYCKPYNQMMTTVACDSKTQYSRRATGEASRRSHNQSEGTPSTL